MVSDRADRPDSGTWSSPAAIPLSAFYDDGRNQGLARFCYAKRDDTLQTALQRLARL